MSNLFVPPKKAPPAHFNDIGFPKFSSEFNNSLLKQVLKCSQPDYVWDNLVLKKDFTPLGALLFGDFGPYTRFGSTKSKDAVFGSEGVGIKARARDTVSANVVADIMKALEPHQRAIARWSGGMIEYPKMLSSLGEVVPWRSPHPAASCGRLEKYLPSKGADFIRPPSQVEVRKAFGALGFPVTLPGPKFLYKYEGLDPRESVTWNPKATAGVPFNCRGDADPDVFVDSGKLAEHWYSVFSEAYKRDSKNGVRSAYRQECVKYPGLFTNVGKCKTENVTRAKSLCGEGRFYNATPLWVRLLMSTVTQVFEENCAPYGLECANSQGVSFFNSGANAFIEVFSAPLDDAALEGVDRINSTNCGDDSKWGAYCKKWNDWIRMAFDMSSFDLTQKNIVLRPVVDAIGEILATSDPVLGQLFSELYLHRPTLLWGLMRALMKSGGPSGTQLQSKVNAALMRIFLDRFEIAVTGHLDNTEEYFAGVAVKVASGLGFTVKLEQFQRFRRETYPTFTSTLRQIPFLYLGYFLWQQDLNENGEVVDSQVYPWFDVRRALPSMPFPNGEWEGEDNLFNQERLVRMLSLYFTLGVPPPCFEPVLDVLYTFCMRAANILKSSGLYDDSIRANFWERHLTAGDEFDQEDNEKVFMGQLMRNLKEDPSDVWSHPPKEVPPIFERFAFGPFNTTPGRLGPDRLPRPRPGQTRTPVTRGNFGRPPPITPWAPPVLRETRGEAQELSSRALRKEHPRFAEEYHNARFQSLDNEEEFARPQKGNRRGRR